MKTTRFQLFLPLSVLVLSTACNLGKEVVSTAREPMVLRTYSAPAGTARDLRNVVNKLTFASRKEADARDVEARAEVMPDGRLALFATERFHTNFEPLLKGLDGKPESATLSFHVWQVRGQAGKGELAPGLDAIRPALEETQKALGPLDFSLLTSTQLVAAAGEEAIAKDENGEVWLRGTVSGDTIFTLFRVDGRGRRYETTLQLQNGRTVVIGQSGLGAGVGGKDDAAATLFYVVQASVGHAAPRSP